MDGNYNSSWIQRFQIKAFKILFRGSHGSYIFLVGPCGFFGATCQLQAYGSHAESLLIMVIQGDKRAGPYGLYDNK